MMIVSFSVDDDMASKRSEYSRDILSFGKRSAPALERNIMAFGKRSPVGTISQKWKSRFVSSCRRTDDLYT